MDKKEFRRVTLPNRVKRITAHAEAAVLEFSIINPIYAVPHVFRWGTGLAKLQLPPFTRDAEDYEDLDLDRPEGFVFHPTESNVIYYFAHGEEDRKFHSRPSCCALLGVYCRPHLAANDRWYGSVSRRFRGQRA